MQALRAPDWTSPCVPLLGASISSSAVLATAAAEGLLAGLDAVQLPRRALLQQPEAVAALRAQGLAVVVNSPVRHLAPTEDKAAALAALAANDAVDVVLTGSRHHLADTASSWR